jgi:hypothetical protein
MVSEDLDGLDPKDIIPSTLLSRRIVFKDFILSKLSIPNLNVYGELKGITIIGSVVDDKRLVSNMFPLIIKSVLRRTFGGIETDAVSST